MSRNEYPQKFHGRVERQMRPATLFRSWVRLASATLFYNTLGGIHFCLTIIVTQRYIMVLDTPVIRQKHIQVLYLQRTALIQSRLNPGNGVGRRHELFRS